MASLSIISSPPGIIPDHDIGHAIAAGRRIEAISRALADPALQNSHRHFRDDAEESFRSGQIPRISKPPLSKCLPPSKASSFIKTTSGENIVRRQTILHNERR